MHKKRILTALLAAAAIACLWWGGRLLTAYAALQPDPLKKLRMLNVACALGSGEARILRGAELMQLNRYADAKKDFDRAIKSSPSYPVTYIYRAELLNAQGETRNALDDYNQAMVLMGPYIKSLAASSRTAKAAQERGMSVADLSRGLYSRLLRDRCALYASSKQAANALLDAGLALEIDPADPRIYAARAAVYVLIEQPQRAQDDIVTALKLGARNDDMETEFSAYPREVHVRLSGILAQAGNKAVSGQKKVRPAIAVPPSKRL
jgi:Tfp pilus assembly protein PilF